MTKWALLTVAALATTVVTAGFVLPAAPADLQTRLAGAAVYTAWAAIAVPPTLVLAGVLSSAVRHGLDAWVRSRDGGAAHRLVA